MTRRQRWYHSFARSYLLARAPRGRFYHQIQLASDCPPGPGIEPTTEGSSVLEARTLPLSYGFRLKKIWLLLLRNPAIAQVNLRDSQLGPHTDFVLTAADQYFIFIPIPEFFSSRAEKCKLWSPAPGQNFSMAGVSSPEELIESRLVPTKPREFL